MSDPFIAQITMFGGNFAPRGWAFCSGQLLPINQNQALFSLLGTIYGGDGRTTFALPELRGRVAMHAGNGPGLTPRPLGQRSGSETNTLNVTQMPNHNHTATTSVTINTHDEDAGSDEVDGNFLANVIGGNQVYSSGPADGTMNAAAATATTNVSAQGGNQAVNNLQPYTVVNYIIALQGVFPSRN